MKHLVKTISIALSIAVVVSLVPSFAIFAEEETEVQVTEQQTEPVVQEEPTVPEVVQPEPEVIEAPVVVEPAPAPEAPAEEIPAVPVQEETVAAENTNVDPTTDLSISGDTSANASMAGIRQEAMFDNSTDLDDGTYPISADDYLFEGGTGKAKLTISEVVVQGGKATAVFTSSSANMTHVYIGTVSSDSEDTSIYNPDTGERCANVYEITNQQVTLPVRVNEKISFAGRTTAMGTPHWIQYYYKITVDEESESEDQPADYTAVDAALAKIPTDLSKYTEESVAALNAAKDAVVRGKTAKDQAEVDAMAQAIEDAIAALVEKPIEDGKINLTITNNTGMFKAVTAYLETVNNKTTLVVALSGTSYSNLFLGNYDQAVANGNNRANWIHYFTDSAGRKAFRIPITSGQNYYPVVSISDSYLAKYEQGQESLQRAFYPRQMTVDPSAKTLVVGDYELTQSLKIINNVSMFVPETAVLETVGGPNSNNYKSNLLLTMGTDSFDKACYGTKETAAKAPAGSIYNVNGRTFTIPVRWVETFGKPETMKTVIGSTVTISFHSVRKNEWYERKFTISEENGTLVIDEVNPDDDSPGSEVTPPTPTPTPGGNQNTDPGYSDTTGGATQAVDNTTGLKDGVYTPDKFSFSGGTGKIAITCTKVEVRDGKAYATIVFRNTKSGTTEVGYVKAGGGIYYCTQSGGTSIVTIPVELNKNNYILAMTTKMSAAHEIGYTIFVYIAGADAKKGNDLTANEKLDEEAPVIAGLEFKDEEKIDHAEFFKIFNYEEGIRLLEVDMRIQGEETKEEGEEPAAEETEVEEDAEAEEEESGAQVIIDEETGMEITLIASKAEAQAELYKGNVIKYLLVPEGVEIPAGLDKEAIVVQVPVDSIYSADEKITDIMKLLGIEDLITSKPEEDKNKEDILAVGDYDDLNLKALVKSKCHMAILPEESIKDSKSKEEFKSLAEDLANLEIPVLVDRAEYEKTDSAKAEWLKVYGVLFGCENEATAAYEKLK